MHRTAGKEDHRRSYNPPEGEHAPFPLHLPHLPTKGSVAVAELTKNIRQKPNEQRYCSEKDSCLLRSAEVSVTSRSFSC